MRNHFFLISALLTLFLGCDPGTGPEEHNGHFDVTITNGITGTLSFTGQWPTTPVELRLITSTVFPPVMSEVVFRDSIPFDTSTYNYQLQMGPGTYKLIGIAWRTEGTEWNFPSICSFYFSGTTPEDSLAPASITIENDTTIVKRVNMRIDRSKARIVSAAKITGSITFNGAWPDSIAEARVIATTRLDLTTLELPTSNDLAIDNDRIAVGSTTYNYEIPAFPGNFLATFVIFFKKDGKLTVQDVLWTNDRGGLDMGNTYTVGLNQSVKGPDFTITF
ncbi:MAG: hypothetical protein JW863_04450 [Chitinispirillaceae bacterium]|nr:hypothetical protein [Chitinispirillaceae bacterium]